MCGIAGILRVVNAAPPVETSVLDRLDAAIARRGPDARARSTVHASGLELTLLHRRLVILDAEGGHQPMHWPSQLVPRLSMVFNGCIYNHRDLRTRFPGEYRSDHSDSEALLHVWRHMGIACLPDLEGMFAIAAFDHDREELFLSRDLAGEKPLWFMLAADCSMLSFASTPGALWDMACADTRRWKPAIDAPVLSRWLWKGYDQRAPMRPIQCVPPGSAVRVRLADNRLSIESSRWAPGLPDRATRPDLDALDEAIARSVRLRLDADVPTGCFLSGGIDSALIASHAAEVLRRAGRTLRTFTLRMPDPAYDESDAAAATARAIGSDHLTLECDAAPVDDLTTLIDNLALPFGDSSLLPTYWLARAARHHVTVALAGDAGDELFAGYRRHLAHWLLSPAMDAVGALPTRGPNGASPKSISSMVARLAEASRHRGYDDILAIFPSPQLAMLCPDAERLLPPARQVIDAPKLDFLEYLPSDLLRKSDTATMAVALELRAPLLAPEIVRVGLGAPMSSLLAWGKTKAPLRSLAMRRVPPEIAGRPKSGFALPLPAWWRQDFGGLRTCLSDILASASPWGGVDIGLDLPPARCRRLLDEHLSGHADHSQRLYLLLALGFWCRRLSAVR